MTLQVHSTANTMRSHSLPERNRRGIDTGSWLEQHLVELGRFYPDLSNTGEQGKQWCLQLKLPLLQSSFTIERLIAILKKTTFIMANKWESWTVLHPTQLSHQSW